MQWQLNNVGHTKKSTMFPIRNICGNVQKLFNINRRIFGHNFKKFLQGIPLYGNVRPSWSVVRCYINHRHFCTDEVTHLNLTHVDKGGKAKMVDVSDKPESKRIAIAVGQVYLGSDTYKLVEENKMKKGDVLSIAQISGIMAAKETSRLIPLCHNIPILEVSVDLMLEPYCKEVHIKSIVKTCSKTGVEMEALTAVSIAALTVYDMCKSVSHDIVIKNIQLIEKHGGRHDFVKNTND